MDDSFRQWRDSSVVEERMSFIISDSDDDIVETSVGKDQVFVISESSDCSENVSRNLTPEKSTWSSSVKFSITSSAIKRRVKKYIPNCSDEDGSSCNEDHSASHSDTEGDYTGDRISDDEEKSKQKGRRINVIENTDSDVCENDDNNLAQERIGNTSEERIKDHESITSNSYEDGRTSPQSDIAISLAKQEIGVGNIDPLIAQKRALLICKMEQLKTQLSKTKLLLVAGNIDLLPDKGKKLQESIAIQEKEIKEIATELENTPLTRSVSPKPYSMKQEVPSMKEEFDPQEKSHSDKFDSYYDTNDAHIKSKTPSEQKQFGKQAQATLDKELALTVDRLQDLHGSLVARPSEEQRAEDPLGLKVTLMPHQKHALAWLLWREQQRPPGGVLADDMGLGKTLTMISLLIVGVAKKNSREIDCQSDEEWTDYNKPLKHKGGTLVVCPASLLSQWESEINNRCKRGMLSVVVYHGTNRENVPKRLARNDVVITTYNILSREFKTRATAYRIHWERIILDEAHVIRNHKSQASEAVCGLVANHRWALTGTPIQNKEMDLYSILKFLKCSPFDDLRVWKRWVDNKNAAGRQRLATVMKTLMLRRTKQELQAKGSLNSLPDKCIEEVLVKLDSQEQLVYEKVLVYSRTLFAQFLAQRADKDHMADLATGKYDKPTFLSNPNKNTQFTKAQNKLLSLHADVKTHEILVLLLRLRQICVHPSLINAMLDQEDMKESGIMDTENVDPDVLLQINNITLHDAGENDVDANEMEIGVDRRVATNVLTSKNPVFNPDRLSSKMKAVLRLVQQILQNNDKLIIVSQWSGVLALVASYLKLVEGATFSMFTGNVPIKDRQGIMDSFNAPNSDPRILLLSLTAGGVGLNLVGGNHLLLIDIHWNPQLEVQAQDRIYRFGQRKNVFIYKFICKDTIEERIKRLQDRKLEIAQNVLSGDKAAISKLSLNDLKSLFGL